MLKPFVLLSNQCVELRRRCPKENGCSEEGVCLPNSINLSCVSDRSIERQQHVPGNHNETPQLTPDSIP